MPNRLTIALAGALGAVTLTSPLWAPPVLRHVDWFTIRQVEISGTRLLEPHEVLQTSPLRRGDNLWTDLEPIAAAIRRHPTVESVTVSRWPPHTLRVRVAEKRAIAYVEAPVLAPIAASGEILPVDPTRARLDLPVLRGPWEELAPTTRSTLLALTEGLGHADPELLAQTSEIRAYPGDSTAVVLQHAAGDIVLPTFIDDVRLAQLRAVLLDLERLLPLAAPAVPDRAASRVQVDARFDEQIVVRLPSSVS